jgi:hypothetical protein
VIDLQAKLKVIEDNGGDKPVIVIALQLGMSHSTAMILKNKNKVTEAIKGPASLKAMRLTNI